MLILLSLLLACTGDKKTNPVYFDADLDGFTDDVDCDDDNAEINPYATEVCDGVDNNCDDIVDDDDPDIDLLPFYLDADGDGFGGIESVELCEIPEGYVENSDDCDDGNADLHPDATEVCDFIDNDCDGDIDDQDSGVVLGENGVIYYLDADDDGFGAADTAAIACLIPEGSVEVADDCDDNEATTNPDGEEFCDAIDNNCNGIVDEQPAGFGQCDECTETVLPSMTGELLTGIQSVSDDADLECFGGGDDTITRWVAPATGIYTISSSADAIGLWQECGDTELDCSTTGSVTKEFEYGESVNIVLEGSDLDLQIWGEAEYHCNDGYDDDNDGLLDCDDADQCWFDSLCGASMCPNFDLVDPIDFETVNGYDLLETTLFGAGNDEEASCFTAGDEDLSYWYQAESSGCAEIYAYSDDFDVHLAVYDSCGGDEIGCNETSAYALGQFETNYASHVRLQLTEGDSYIIVVDGLPAVSTEKFMLAIDHIATYDCDGSPVGQ